MAGAGQKLKKPAAGGRWHGQGLWAKISGGLLGWALRCCAGQHCGHIVAGLGMGMGTFLLGWVGLRWPGLGAAMLGWRYPTGLSEPEGCWAVTSRG